MSTQQSTQYGFYHTESKTFFYFQSEQEFSQFMDVYKRYSTEATRQIEEMNKANLDEFNNVFQELNSSSYENGGQLRQLDF